MTRTARIAVGAVAVLLIPLAAAAADFATDYFGVTLPPGFAAPVKTDTNQQGIDTITWVSKAPTGEAIVISVSKMPAKVADPVKLMDSTRDSLLKSVKGTLESEQTLSGDKPGRVISFKTPQAFLRSRLVVDGDKLYQVLYVGRSEEQRTAVAQMFDSFRITAPAAMTSSAPPVPVPPPVTSTH
jgi:hypothetical protein